MAEFKKQSSRLPAPAPLGFPEPPRPLPDGDFEAFCRGVKDLIGVDLSLYKRNQMERRARGLAMRSHVETLSEYLALLRTDSELLDKFTERMTITVSQLWRNNDIFEAIDQELIPMLAAQAGGRRLEFWSAGCSYGAETYTLAAVCSEHSGQMEKLPLIEGTDINPRMIELARRGVFSKEDARDAPPALMSKYFEKQADGGWKAAPNLAKLVRFKVEDLFASKDKAVDMILFRNVSIHFERERRDEVHGILAGSLRPGGVLVLGSTEMIVAPTEIGLERVRPFVYRREPTGAA